MFVEKKELIWFYPPAILVYGHKINKHIDINMQHMQTYFISFAVQLVTNWN